MGIAGKTGTHFTKKDIASQRTPAIGYKNLRFAHQATLGDTTINLSALVTPSTDLYSSFVNPTVADLNAANLLFTKNGLVLISSLTGVMASSSYSVTANMTISLLNAAEDNEIFEGIILNVAKSGVQMVDADPLNVTGTLSAGTTDFNVGKPFKVNYNSSYQQGQVLFFMKGQLLKRNTGNATAGATADGHYQEIDAGGGTGTIIRLNVAPLTDEEVTAVSNGLAFSLPDDSVKAVVQTLAGQIQSVIEDVAALSGNATTKYQAAPSDVDLKTFGDRVLTAEANISALKVTSMVRVDTPNGHGSTNTTIRRFTNTTESAGGAITYADSATLGATFTINENGVYDISYTDKRSSGAVSFGISKNSSQLTTSITGITTANRLITTDAATALFNNVSVCVRLSAGDVIRPHDDGSADNATADAQFVITQVAKF